MCSNASGASAAALRKLFRGLAWASRSLNRSWRCMAAGSGSRARVDTARHSTSPSPLRRRWSIRCRDGMLDRPAVGSHGLFTVLVADDNEVAQRLCRRVLEKAGYQVLIASDGVEAVELALAELPDMIL